MDHLCYLCLVFVMLLRLFIAAWWLTEWKGAALLSLVCDVYCDFVTFPFGILWQVWYLITSILNPRCLSYFTYLIKGSISMKRASSYKTFY